MKKLVLILAALASTSAQAQPPASPLTPVPAAATVISAEHKAEAARLVRLLYSEEFEMQQVDTVINWTITEVLKGNEEAQLEKKYPGLYRYAVGRMRPEFQAMVKKVAPAQRAEMTDFFAAKMTIQDLKDVSQFWESPLGVKYMTLLRKNMTFSETLKDALQSPDGTDMKREPAEKDAENAAMKTVGEATPDDLINIGKFFSENPGGKRLLALKDEKFALDLKWANIEPDPDLMAAATVKVQEGAVAYMQKIDAERAGAKKAKLPQKTN